MKPDKKVCVVEDNDGNACGDAAEWVAYYKNEQEGFDATWLLCTFHFGRWKKACESYKRLDSNDL